MNVNAFPTAPVAKRLCTIGHVVHDPHTNGVQDLETFSSLAEHVGRIYAVAKSTTARDQLFHARGVVVIALAVRSGPFSRIQFVARAVGLGLRLHWRRKVDVFAASDPLISGIAGLTLRLLTHRPLLVHLQGELLGIPANGASGLRRSVIGAIGAAVCRRADMVRCVSLATLAQAVEKGVSPSRLVYLPSRVDTNRFSPMKRTQLPGHAEDKLFQQRGRTVMYAGTLSTPKGVAFLVHAFAQVLEREPMTTLALVGSGPNEPELRSLTDELGIQANVIFAGRVPHTDMPMYLTAADVVVLPSLHEGLPRIILEAQATGLPVVATSVGGVPEVVQDGKTGLLVPPADSTALRDAICRILAEPKLARQLGRAARELVKRRYDRASNLLAYADLVTTVSALDPRKRRKG